MSVVAAALLFLSSFETAYLTFGKDEINDSRYISLGLTDDFNGLIKDRIEIGYWKDPYNSSSFYTTYQLGLSAKNEIVYAEFFTGPSLITQPDYRLSTPFEFKHDIGIGVLGKDKVGIGINYSHLSNAGIREPNLGRDSLQLKLTLPF